MTTRVCLNGRLLLPEQATISIFDRGFLYGDSVYEVIRTYRSVAFELAAHLDRLESSALRIGMMLPVPLSQIAQEVVETHVSTGNGDSYLRVVVTRGAGEIGLDPALAEAPVRIVIAQPLKEPPPETYEQGVRVALVSVRRNLRAAVDPAAKTGNYLNSILAVAEAKKRGGYEAIMLDHRGFVSEGASSNVFAVLGGLLLTPPLDVGILKGITRDVVFEVARRAGIRVLEVHMGEELLAQADEVFISSSIRELVPVVAIDDAVVGDGRVGPVFRKIRAGFAAYVEEAIAAKKAKP